ncbi:MAG TPA: hypothetical protein VGF64_17010 [Acidimicrobiales bacterium]|jgi:hypothetical protein
MSDDTLGDPIEAFAGESYRPPAVGERFGETPAVAAQVHEGGPEPQPVGPDTSPAQMGTSTPPTHEPMSSGQHLQPANPLVSGPEGISATQAGEHQEEFMKQMGR